MTLKSDNSNAIYREACDLFPGGVNSPVRAFKSVNSTPFVVESAAGAYLTDCDQNKYIDYVLSWGPMVLGHRHPEVEKAVIEALAQGWTYGAPCEKENLLGKKVKELFPSMEMMRFVNSGTEAVMGAIRLARGVTGKEIIVKCDGGYHGHSDGLLVAAGSGLATLGTSNSSGVPKEFASKTIVIPINDIDALSAAFKNYPENIAAFILEPVNGNVGVIKPEPGYLESAKELCHQHGSKLIFDEVMCGFRASLGGAQGLYQVTPDITVLGKVIGGGFPVGAYGASKELMENIAPLGGVYQAGTLSGNPVAMAAGLKTLELLQESENAKANLQMDRLEKGLLEITQNMPCFYNRVGTMYSLFLTPGPIKNYQDVCKGDADIFAKFHRSMLEKGVYLAPSAFEAGFMSSAHNDDVIDTTLEAFKDCLKAIF